MLKAWFQGRRIAIANELKGPHKRNLGRMWLYLYSLHKGCCGAQKWDITKKHDARMDVLLATQIPEFLVPSNPILFSVRRP